MRGGVDASVEAMACRLHSESSGHRGTPRTTAATTSSPRSIIITQPAAGAGNPHHGSLDGTFAAGKSRRRTLIGMSSTMAAP